MGKCNKRELENLLESARCCLRMPIIKAIGRSNLSMDAICHIAHVPEGLLYKILQSRENPWPELMADLSVVLNTSITKTHIDVVNQLQRINNSINHELQKARESADDTSGKDRIAFQKIIIELSAEVRRQLDAQLKIFELWHDTRIIHEFQTEVLNILDEVKPGLRDEIITRLKQRRAVRSTVKFS